MLSVLASMENDVLIAINEIGTVLANLWYGIESTRASYSGEFRSTSAKLGLWDKWRNLAKFGREAGTSIWTWGEYGLHEIFERISKHNVLYINH